MSLRPVEPPEENATEEEPQGVELWIMPYLRDSALWPVTLVVVAHAVAFFALVLLAVARDRQPVGFGALGVVGYLSFLAMRYEVRKTGSPGGITWLIAATWVLSAIAAYFGGRWGYI